jgi:hypothetical protein
VIGGTWTIRCPVRDRVSFGEHDVLVVSCRPGLAIMPATTLVATTPGNIVAYASDNMLLKTNARLIILEFLEREF